MILRTITTLCWIFDERKRGGGLRLVTGLLQKVGHWKLCWKLSFTLNTMKHRDCHADIFISVEIQWRQTTFVKCVLILSGLRNSFDRQLSCKLPGKLKLDYIIYADFVFCKVCFWRSKQPSEYLDFTAGYPQEDHAFLPRCMHLFERNHSISHLQIFQESKRFKRSINSPCQLS